MNTSSTWLSFNSNYKQLYIQANYCIDTYLGTLVRCVSFFLQLPDRTRKVGDFMSAVCARCGGEETVVMDSSITLHLGIHSQNLNVTLEKLDGEKIMPDEKVTSFYQQKVLPPVQKKIPITQKVTVLIFQIYPLGNLPNCD